MYKKMKKWIAGMALCSGIMIGIPAITAQANDEGIEAMYVQASSVQANLIISSGTATCKSTITNTKVANLKKTTAVSKGKYRIKAVLSNGVETITKYSSTVTY